MLDFDHLHIAEREKIGSIFTDVAAILVADPCKVFQDEDGSRPTYNDYLETAFDGPHQHPVTELEGAIVVSTGCDGYCPVYLETDDDGNRRLVVELSCLVKP